MLQQAADIPQGVTRDIIASDIGCGFLMQLTLLVHAYQSHAAAIHHVFTAAVKAIPQQVLTLHTQHNEHEHWKRRWHQAKHRGVSAPTYSQPEWLQNQGCQCTPEHTTRQSNHQFCLSSTGMSWTAVAWLSTKQNDNTRTNLNTPFP